MWMTAALLSLSLAGTESPAGLRLGPEEVAIGPNGGVVDGGPAWLVWRRGDGGGAEGLVEAAAGHLGLPVAELLLADPDGRVVAAAEVAAGGGGPVVVYGRRVGEHWMWPAGLVLGLPGPLPLPDDGAAVAGAAPGSCPTQQYELEMLSMCAPSLIRVYAIHPFMCACRAWSTLPAARLSSRRPPVR